MHFTIAHAVPSANAGTLVDFVSKRFF